MRAKPKFGFSTIAYPAPLLPSVEKQIDIAAKRPGGPGEAYYSELKPLLVEYGTVARMMEKMPNAEEVKACLQTVKEASSELKTILECIDDISMMELLTCLDDPELPVRLRRDTASLIAGVEKTLRGRKTPRKKKTEIAVSLASAIKRLMKAHDMKTTLTRNGKWALRFKEAAGWCGINFPDEVLNILRKASKLPNTKTL